VCVCVCVCVCDCVCVCVCVCLCMCACVFVRLHARFAAGTYLRARARVCVHVLLACSLVRV